MLKSSLLKKSWLTAANKFNRTQPIRQIETKSIKELLVLKKPAENKVRVVGWIKSFRDQKEIKFAHLNDGTDSSHLQLVFLNDCFKPADQSIFDSLHYNTAVECEGLLVKSAHKKQNVELKVTDLKVLGECDPSSYPFKAKSKYTFEQIRPYVHLRSHSAIFADVMKLRSDLTLNVHEYFAKNDFTHVHTPIITSNNCEGGCETFQVVSNEKDQELKKIADEYKKSDSSKSLSDSENYSNFFLRSSYLTASAQLHLETMTTTLGKVYTLSPTFRAEKSLTRHHLAEFYMLEAELIDMNNLEQLLDVAEDFLKNVSLNILTKSLENNGVWRDSQKDHVKFLIDLFKSERKFVRISYTEAIKLLNSLLKKKKYSNLSKKSIEFGEDLNKEQEKLLVEHFENVPVFICRYPRAIKPFYMRRSLDDENLVENFDLLAPKVGEIIGGSLREHRLDLLVDSIRRQELDMSNFELYLETKKYGAMKMGGFGLGLERFMQFLFNIENIRDTCAFPRSLYNCKM